MLDINLFREKAGGNPELVRESQRARGAKVEIVDEVIAIDEEWRKAQFQVDETNKRINALNKEMGTLMKAGKKAEAEPLKEQKKTLEAQKEAQQTASDELKAKLFKTIGNIGNLVHDSVPVSLTEDDNAITKTFWPAGRSEEAERAKKNSLVAKDAKSGVPGMYSHHEVLEKLEGYDAVRGSKIAGHRGYFLMGPGVELNLALIQFGLNFLGGRGFTKLWTPFFMRKELMAKTAQLEEFDEALYKVVGEETDDASAMYLIATSEQPISAFHSDEWFSEPGELPKRYAGQSTCFRKEAGAAGRDNWGIFRVHQFEKVEQFCITEPEKSWKEHEAMLKNAEDFYQSLGIPYRVVTIVSGALNNAAAKKYDLEAWFPFQTQYKELVSCSNCTDYQSRRLEIRYGTKKVNDQVKKYVHCLNCTLVATERALCCILENYQTEDGVVVPEVLRPYMGGKEFLPYTKGVPKHKKTDDLSEGVKNLQAPSTTFGTIYSYSNDHRTARALIAASYGNRDINVTEIELGVDNLKPEFLSKFPLGKVPAFEGADGYTLYESNAISRYLGGDALSGGSDPRIASLISQFVGLNDRELVPAETVWLYPIYGWLPHNAEMVARAKEEVSRVLAYLDSHLLSRTFLVGESVTLADITLVTTLQNFYKTVFDKDFRKRFGNVNRWFLTCVNQPNFAKVLGEVKLVETALAHKVVAKKANGVEGKANEVKTKEVKPKGGPKSNGAPVARQQPTGNVKTAPVPHGAPVPPPDAQQRIDGARALFPSKSSVQTTALSGSQISSLWDTHFHHGAFDVYRVRYRFPTELESTRDSLSRATAFGKTLVNVFGSAMVVGGLGIVGVDDDNEIVGYVVAVAGAEVEGKVKTFVEGQSDYEIVGVLGKAAAVQADKEYEGRVRAEFGEVLGGGKSWNGKPVAGRVTF